MLIDTFPEIIKKWRRFMSADDDGRLEVWLEYMSPFPELSNKQKANYEHAEQSWAEIANSKVFPNRDNRMTEMRRAASLIPDMAPKLVASARQVLTMQFDPTIVVYVGIGCGAG